MRKLVLLLLVSDACRAEIIDRVAVVVGNRVITESEILREIRLTALLNGTPLEFGAESKRKTAERLVEQRLIRNEMESSLYPLPTPEDVQEVLKEVQTKYPNPTKYQEELRRTGVGEDELKAHLLRQLTTLRFIEFRFRPGIQVGEEEMVKYFNERLAPELKRANPEVDLALNDYRAQVEQALIGELVDKASDAWLKDTRDRTRIEFRPAAFVAELARQETSQ